jgi:hypothetical protein
MGASRIRVIALTVVMTLLQTAAVSWQVAKAPLAVGATAEKNGLLAFIDGGRFVYTVRPNDPSSARYLVINNAFGLAWSPGGTELAVLRGPTSGRRQIDIVEPNGDLIDTFLSPYRPFGGLDWSPDADRIAFGCEVDKPDNSMSPEVCLLDMRDGDVRVLTNPYDDIRAQDDKASQELTLSWRPQGNLIAYSAYHGAQTDIGVVSEDGGATTLLTSDEARNPDWSPDGSKIVMYDPISHAGEPTGIVVMSSNGDVLNRHSLVPIKDSFWQDPEWSPDGTRIAFATYEPQPETGTELYSVLAAGGGDRKAHTAFPYAPDTYEHGARQAAWAPALPRGCGSGHTAVRAAPAVSNTQEATAAAGSKLSGVVRDGKRSRDGHAKPLTGAWVQLRQDGHVVEGPIATNASGEYVFSGIAKGVYRVRVMLSDKKAGGPIFDVAHFETACSPTWIEVSASVRGTSTTRDIAFSDRERLAAVSNDVPPSYYEDLSDEAAIFTNLRKFTDWAREQTAADGGPIFTLSSSEGPLPVHVYSFALDSHALSAGAYYEPNNGTPEIHFSYEDSLYGNRAGRYTDAPENGEWHEFTHHLQVAGISHKSCTRVKNHGGYFINADTCDSVSEGWAEFLPIVAGNDIFGTFSSVYADFGDLEPNGWVAWDRDSEDLAFCSLLWDLFDSHEDSKPVLIREAAGKVTSATLKDEISIPLAKLWSVYTHQGGSPTVFSTIQKLRSDPFVERKGWDKLTIDLDGDGTMDIAPLDEPFLMHGFFPMKDPNFLPHPIYDVDYATDLGVPDETRDILIGTTAHPVEQPDGSYVFTVRNHRYDPQANILVKVRDASGAPLPGATVTLTLKYPELTRTVTVPLQGAQGLVHLELPDPFGDPVDPWAPAPDCSQKITYPVVVTVRATLDGDDSTNRLSFGNCGYERAVVDATGSWALSKTLTIP